MCLFRKCDETVIETKEYPSLVDRMKEIGVGMRRGESAYVDMLNRPVLTTIKCNACGRIRIDRRTV